MNLDLIQVDPAEAAAKLAEYASLIGQERTAEDEALAMAYRAALRGLPVISLSAAIIAGGWHDNKLPRIAVANADVKMCHVEWEYGADLLFGDSNDWRWNRGALVGQRTVRVHIPGDDRPVGVRLARGGNAPVPLIPPRLRPKPRRLKHCHVLWEVESWTRQPPRDPALIKHIRGDLWAVLAIWDLTPLERLVLAQRTR